MSNFIEFEGHVINTDFIKAVYPIRRETSWPYFLISLGEEFNDITINAEPQMKRPSDGPITMLGTSAALEIVRKKRNDFIERFLIPAAFRTKEGS